MQRNNYIGSVFIYIIAFLALSKSAPETPRPSFQPLFPDQNKLYTYTFKTNVTTAVITPSDDGSYWTMEGKLSIQVYDDFGRARFFLDDLKTLVHSQHGSSTHQSNDAADFLKNPWEVGICFSAIYVDAEPVWVTNMKRALTFNFLMTAPRHLHSTFSNDEPCLYGNCVVVYSRLGSKTRKYNRLVDLKRNRPSTYEQGCLPNNSAEMYYRPSYSEDTTNIMATERLYEMDEKRGLKSLELNSDFQYRSRDHILSVSTQLSLHYESDKPAETIQKLNLSEVSIQYVSHSHDNPSNGIWNRTQGELKNRTYEKLLTIAKKGIDADNIVRNASLIHSLDFIELLTIMSQLDFASLSQLFEDMLGTSYELETSKNIFLEVLPYVRTEACAKLIRHLVVDLKSKIEDMILLSLIRKLPYNLIDYRQGLLGELEVFTKLGPDYPQEIRHAGILSFATLVYKTMVVKFDQEYFDDIYDKYLRMYNNCPQYLDRMVWLQGLTNIGTSVANYLDEIHTDHNKDRHERLWASLGSMSIWRGLRLENTLPILMNDTEHIQLRIIALHGFLSSAVGARDFINVHDYIKTCDNDQLKRFWYTTVKSLEKNRFYNRYKSASYYIPFVSNLVHNPDLKYWATNNYIVSQEPSLDTQGPMFQLLTVGGPWSGPPEMIIVDFSTGGEQAFNAAIYIIAEGVTSNVFKRLQNFNATERNAGSLLEELKKMKVEMIESEKVHIDIVVKIQEKTIYATHINQARFDSWNIQDLKKSIEDFVRFGSHINQQMVYYPIQMVKDLPTELGTPIRLLSTIVSFTSLRGNLTAPSTEDVLTWRNDLHIRYQGTSVISVSTDGPLQPSEHTARIQQSMVVHLPIKLDVSISPAAKSFELIWTNPAQSGGIAMHSRTQIAINSDNEKEVYTVTTKKHKTNGDGIFFDCEHPISGSEISQLISKNYNILTSLQPSHFILKILRLISSPTAGSCGLILPPRQLQTGNKLKLEVKLDELIWDGDDISKGLKVDNDIKPDYDNKSGNDNTPGNDTKKIDESGDKTKDYDNEMKLKLSYTFNYYRETDDLLDIYLLVKGLIEVESDGNNGSLTMMVSSKQPHSDAAGRFFTLCLREQHNIVNAPFKVDFTLIPANYEGSISMTTSSVPESCAEPNSELELKFKSTREHAGLRNLEVHASGKNIPKLNVDGSDIVGQSEVIELLKSFSQHLSGDESYASAVLKEENGVASVSVNGSEEVEIKSDSFSWLPGSWTTLQGMRKLGLYHVCRIQGSKVHTFAGSTGKMPSWYYETLAVGECTETPRFAVTLKHPNAGVTLHTGGAVHTSYHGIPVAGGDFRTTTKGNATLIRSKLTGVYVYQRLNTEIVILVPHAYLSTACGVCMGQEYYKLQRR